MLAHDLEARFYFAKALILKAGTLAHDYFERREALTVEHKGLQDVVSIADTAVELLIRQELAGAFSQDSFLGEEDAARDIANFKASASECIWVVDPIDGTALFLNGIPSWCISIALLVEGQIAIGLIYDPCNHELFCAQRGLGARLNGKPIKVSPATNVSDGMTGVGFSHRVKPELCLHFLSKLLNDGGMYVRSGSGALTLAYVAAGRLIGYYEPHINAWDCLAGILLIEEAGGWVDDFLANEGLATGNPILCGAKGLQQTLSSYCLKESVLGNYH